MALDPTLKEQFIKDSIKKYFVDSLSTGENIPLSFDGDVSIPDTTMVSEWVMVVFGDLSFDAIGVQELEVYCSSRVDPEGFRLSELRDKVVNYLIDLNKEDGLARIKLYQSHPTDAWVEKGSMVVFLEGETPAIDAKDGSKVKIISVSVKWGAK